MYTAAYRGTILPLSSDIHRPVWSVMIPVHNCAAYLRETLQSVLAQDLGPDIMQIEVVDDNSTEDDPEAIVQEIGQGRVEFYKHTQGIGHVDNFLSCLQRSRGQLIHLLHGDDCVRDGFYGKMQCLFEQYPDIGAAFCRHIVMDDYGAWQRISPLEQMESGILSDWFEKIAVVNRLQTPSMVVRREVYEKLGGFDKRPGCCEDWEMWVRIATSYKVGYEVEPLALYRDRSNSITKNAVRIGKNIHDARVAMEIIQTYIPEENQKKVHRLSSQEWAFWGLYYAERFLQVEDYQGFLNQIKESLKASFSVRVLMRVTILLVKTIVAWYSRFPLSMQPREQKQP
jgi:glycosyltransferase involved in cell wall biosynthesis